MLKFCHHGSIASAAKQAARAVHCSVTTMSVNTPGMARYIASDCPSLRRQQRSITGALSDAYWRSAVSPRRQFHSSVVVRAVPDVAVSDVNALVRGGEWQYLDVRYAASITWHNIYFISRTIARWSDIKITYMCSPQILASCQQSSFTALHSCGKASLQSKAHIRVHSTGLCRSLRMDTPLKP